MLKQTGLKYNFMIITIAAIVIVTSISGFILHYLIVSTQSYSPSYLLLVSFFNILAGVTGVFLITKLMIQPVVQLTEKVHQVQQGNLDLRIWDKNPTPWMDEMDQLFYGFDTMVQHLKKTIDELTVAKMEAERISREAYESKVKLEAIFSNIADGIMILDRDYRIISANPVIQNFMGRSIEQITGKYCFEMCNGTANRCSFCQANITFETGKHVSTYCTKSMPGESGERILEIHDFPLLNKDGEVEYIIEYVKDVTEAVRKQSKLESSRRLAEIGEMAAKVAHEVRNPLNAIKGATHYLNGAIQDAELAPYIELIETQADRVNQVATELLDLSKPLQPVFQPGDVATVIERSLAVTAPCLAAKHIAVHRQIAPNLPQIPLDEHQMEQALANLIQNAVDAMDDYGRLGIYATLSAAGNGHDHPKVNITISDNGSGMVQDQCQDVFKPFFTTKIQGTGLGLTIVKKIIDHHQGSILINSQKGKGTDVIISLPLKPHRYEEKELYLSH